MKEIKIKDIKRLDLIFGQIKIKIKSEYSRQRYLTII